MKDHEGEAAKKVESSVLRPQPPKLGVRGRNMIIPAKVENKPYAGIHQPAKSKTLLPGEIRQDSGAIIKIGEDQGGHKASAQRARKTAPIVFKTPQDTVHTLRNGTNLHVPTECIG